MKIRLKTEIPGPRSREMMAQRNREVARGPFHVAPVFIAKAQGALVEDVDGNVFIDFAAGIGVVNVGHAAESVVGAIRSQSAQYIHAGFNVTPYAGYVEVCRRLNSATPGNFAKRSFLANSGAEAVENAIKIARHFTKRTEIACFDHAFHGRTLMAMATTYKERPYKEGFGPFPEVVRLSLPVGSVEESFEGINPQTIAAVIVEPVMGEGGFIPVPASFLQSLSLFCKAHGIVFIVDEIQTGFGRTGTLFASEQLGIEPDIILSAKGLAGGMPLSAVTGRQEIMDSPPVGGIGGTFGGNPVSCAAAMAVFDSFSDGSLLRHARHLGELLRAELVRWREEFPMSISEVRGLGPMQAIVLKDDATAKFISSYSIQHGVLVMTAGSLGNVIRFLFPLIIDDKTLLEGLSVVRDSLTASS